MKKERNKGFLYVDGGLTHLTTIKLKFDAPNWLVAPKNIIPDA